MLNQASYDSDLRKMYSAEYMGHTIDLYACSSFYQAIIDRQHPIKGYSLSDVEYATESFIENLVKVE